MQLAGFVPPMDDELSDEACVGVSMSAGTEGQQKEIKRKVSYSG